MAKMETMNDTIVPVNKMIVAFKSKLFPPAKNLTIFSKLAPNIVGIPKKNENSADTKREPPIKMAPRIVAPERDVPGIKARTWKKPTIKAN